MTPNGRAVPVPPKRDGDMRATVNADEALLAAMAIAYTWFNTWGTCCGMGCCKDPHKGMKKIAPTKEDPDADLRAK